MTDVWSTNADDARIHHQDDRDPAGELGITEWDDRVALGDHMGGVEEGTRLATRGRMTLFRSDDGGTAWVDSGSIIEPRSNRTPELSNLDRADRGLPFAASDHTSWGVWWVTILLAGTAVVFGIPTITLLALHLFGVL